MIEQDSPASTIESKITTPEFIRRRLHFIDILRAAACLWVMLRHLVKPETFANHHLHFAYRAVAFIGTIGWLGVSLFLVLSGFCMYYPLIRKAEASSISLDLAAFAKRRAWRILPPYYCAMVAAIVVSFAVHPHESSAKYLTLAGGMDVILHLLMLHNLVGYTIGSINGNFWSLALECQLYVIFPGLIFLAAKFGFRSLLLVTVILSAAWQITAWKFVPHLSSEDGHYMVLFNAVFGRCFEFAAGMTAASFVARPKPRSTFYAAIAASIFAIIGVCYAYFVTIDGPPMCELWGIVFGCLIVALSSIDDQKLVAHSIPRFFVWVGTISYSIYLIQGIIYSAVFTTAGRHHVHSEAITFPLVIVASIGLGYCFHLMFERPFMKPGSGYFARFSKA